MSVSDAARRRLVLEQAVNFRDLGGYPTRDGAMTTWGKLFRADSLDLLTEADLRRLERLGLRTACDLRHPTEADRYPSRFRGHARVAYYHIAVSLPPADDPVVPKLGAARYRLLYPFILDHGAPTFRALFERLADPESYPLVFHCTAGKDRTGVVAAVLLLAAGVDRDTALADYLETRRHIEELRARLEAFVRARGVDPARYLIDVYPEAMAGALDHLERRYGTAEDYLLGCGITPAQLDAFRAIFVTRPAQPQQPEP